MVERKVFLPCGEEGVALELPGPVPVLESLQLSPLPHPREAVAGALAAPAGTPPLEELAAGRRDAVLVVSDRTRPVPNRVILPPLVEVLERAGIGRDRITLLIATGMHRPCRGAELEELVGPDLAATCRVVNHDCRDPSACRPVCTLEAVPFEVNRIYLEADLKILTGLVEPHFYAGFSGGRKSLVPGLSSFETLRFMHSFEMIEHPAVTNCLLEDNPFHRHALEAAREAGVDFILNAVVDRERRPLAFFAGDLDLAHRQACDLVYSTSTARVARPLDLVITSAGGHPLDATFYQVSKGLVAAAGVLREGGTILLSCGCAEGLGGPEFTHLMREGLDREAFLARYSRPENFTRDQWCAQSIYQVLSRAGRVLVHSPGLEREDLERLGMEKVEDLPGAAAELLARAEAAAVIPEGPYLVGMVEAPD